MNELFNVKDKVVVKELLHTSQKKVQKLLCSIEAKKQEKHW